MAARILPKQICKCGYKNIIPSSKHWLWDLGLLPVWCSGCKNLLEPHIPDHKAAPKRQVDIVNDTLGRIAELPPMGMSPAQRLMPEVRKLQKLIIESNPAGASDFFKQAWSEIRRTDKATPIFPQNWLKF